QSPQLLSVKKIGASYSVMKDTIVLNTPRAGFAITAFDTQSGSTNPNGIYQADLYDGNQWVIGFQMDAISYDNARGINAHIDYKTKTRGGPWLQQLFRLPGYTNSIYRSFKGNGNIDLSDGLVHALRIEVKDAYGNAAGLNFKVLYKENNQSIRQMSGKVFYPLMLDVFEQHDCAFYLGEKSLYDSVHINYSKSPSFPKDISAVHSIGTDFIPINEPMLVRIRLIRDLPIVKKDKVLMQRFLKSTKEVSKVEWQGGWASARFRQFGNFQLILDEVAPVISAIGFTEGGNLKKANRIVILVKDDHEIIKHFRALLDGHWIRFTNDKQKSFIYTFDEHCAAGSHELSITAEDEAGNVATRIFHFTR
ncbi:MAG TPA: hypothetical protein VK543_11580, partial [Puia sp.]|nr:hypothetical protein [Puia sp.]